MTQTQTGRDKQRKLTHRNRQTDRQAERQTDGQTGRQTGRQTCSARAWMGVTNTHLESGAAENMRRMANSAQMVLPLPLGPPTNTSSSVL